jgi:hypothetical protein
MDLQRLHEEAYRWEIVVALMRDHGGFCRKIRFLGKIQKSGVRNAMTYRLPNSRKSNFATEPAEPGKFKA